MPYFLLPRGIFVETCHLNFSNATIGFFGDLRLQKRGQKLFSQLCKSMVMNIRGFTQSRGDEVATFRFLGNPNVTKEELELSAAKKTDANCKNARHVLIVNDTCEITYPTQEKKKVGFGATTHRETLGFFIHPNLVLDADSEEILGLAGVKVWKRIGKKEEGEWDYKGKAIEEKESYKWIESHQRANNYLGNELKKTFVTDRESDVYEYMSLVIDAGNYFVVRSGQERNLGTKESLSEHVTSKKEIGIIELDLAANRYRKGGRVKLRVKSGSLAISKPKKKSKTFYPNELRVNFIDVEEIGVRKGKEKIHWRLLTNHPVDGLEGKIINYYKLRWKVELIFASLKKKGLMIESSQIQSFEKMEKLIVITLLSAINIFHLISCRDGTDDKEASLIFSKKQLEFLALLSTRILAGRSEKQKNPFPINKMSWAAWVIARLGGWKGYKSERPPGHVTFIRGLEKFHTMYEGWMLVDFSCFEV